MLLEIIILAIIQGIAEFLPISSSGHLAILSAMMEVKESASLAVILHAGTLGSILVVFWNRILKLLSSDRRVVPLLVIGTVPAGIAGIIIKSQFEEILENPLLAGAMLIVTGAMLIILGRLNEKSGTYQKMSLGAAFLVGCFQAFAILPGISRSGSTILGGRLLGLKNEDSVTFSFLLAIPAILGATVLELKDMLEAGPGPYSATELVAGAVIAFIVGIFALKWLVHWSQKARLHWFAWWCIPAGLWVIYYFTVNAPVVSA